MRSLTISRVFAACLAAVFILPAQEPADKEKSGTTQRILHRVGKTVDKAADKTVDATKTAAGKTAEVSKDVAGKTASTTKTAAGKTADASKTAAKKTAEAGETAGRTAASATGEGLSRAGGTLKKAGDKTEKEDGSKKKSPE